EAAVEVSENGIRLHGDRSAELRDADIGAAELVPADAIGRIRDIERLAWYAARDRCSAPDRCGRDARGLEQGPGGCVEVAHDLRSSTQRAWTAAYLSTVALVRERINLWWVHQPARDRWCTQASVALAPRRCDAVAARVSDRLAKVLREVIEHDHV